MKVNRILVAVTLLFATFFVGVADEAVFNFLDAVSSEDLPSDEEMDPTTIVRDYPAIQIAFGTTNDVVICERISSVASNLMLSTETCTNKLSMLRLSTALMLLGDYSMTNSLPLFAEVMTNCVYEGVVNEAAWYLGRAKGPVPSLVAFLQGLPNLDLSPVRINDIYKGVYRGLNSRRGSVVETNRTITIALSGLQNPNAWQASDLELSYIWPEFSFSSNRYTAVLLMRSDSANPASNYYVNKVVSELEALPPGTMQMLSTNHLGAAWNEN